MNLYIKQKVFSWTDKFTVRDEAGNVRFTVGGESLWARFSTFMPPMVRG